MSYNKKTYHFLQYFSYVGLEESHQVLKNVVRRGQTKVSSLCGVLGKITINKGVGDEKCLWFLGGCSYTMFAVFIVTKYIVFPLVIISDLSLNPRKFLEIHLVTTMTEKGLSNKYPQ